MQDYIIRPAHADDADTIATLILELAEYENLTHEAAPDIEALRQHLSPENTPYCEALLALHEPTNKAIGFALFFQNYSTFLTRWGIYLEDLYVQPAFRGQGIGSSLLKRLAQIAVERECKRLDWSVLTWNEPAIGFYNRLGAKPLEAWSGMRLQGEALIELGSS